MTTSHENRQFFPLSDLNLYEKIAHVDNSVSQFLYYKIVAKIVHGLDELLQERTVPITCAAPRMVLRVVCTSCTYVFL